jgi:aryl-alcohol dehydrogenase-like predicted oxidoreductase
MGADGFTLAGTDVHLPPIGVGTWSWGDAKTWGMGTYDAATTEATIEEAWAASIDAGATFFDTAEVYGGGESERIIGRCSPATRTGRRRCSSPPSSCRSRGS